MRKVLITMVLLLTTVSMYSQINPVTHKPKSPAKSQTTTGEKATVSKKKSTAKSLPVTLSDGEYIDLGLPSGTLWAACNIGAEKPEDYGDYFACGETVGLKGGKTEFESNTYKWSPNGYYRMKVKESSGNTPETTKLALEDDAAYVYSDGQACMPSLEQIEELKENCTWTWTSYHGTKGYHVKGKNGNSIFLPAAGGYHGTLLENEGEKGLYWSNTLKTNGSLYTINWLFLDYWVIERNCCNYDSYGYWGFCVRSVKMK